MQVQRSRTGHRNSTLPFEAHDAAEEQHEAEAPRIQTFSGLSSLFS